MVIGFPGSVHDSRVFRASPLCTNIEEMCGENYLLGDSGYPCQKNLLTPFKEIGHLTRRQINYNIKLAKTRYVVEHCFGILKQKFRQLYHLKLRSDDMIANFIRACCVLHNLGLNDNRNYDNIEAEVEIEDNEDVQIENNDRVEVDNRDNINGIEFRNRVMNILPM